MLQSIWRITGLMAEFYEIVLMVDADTKVFPDSLTHMVAEMVKDPTIMGLCGETKFLTRRKPGLQQSKFLNIIFHIIKPRRLNRFSVGLLVYLVVSVCIESRHQRGPMDIGCLFWQILISWKDILIMWLILYIVRICYYWVKIVIFRH